MSDNGESDVAFPQGSGKCALAVWHPCFHVAGPIEAILFYFSIRLGHQRIPAHLLQLLLLGDFSIHHVGDG